MSREGGRGVRRHRKRRTLGPALRRGLVGLLLGPSDAFLALLSLFSGIPILINPHGLSPGSMLALLPIWGIYIWALGMTLGGVASLAGIFFHERGLQRVGTVFLCAISGVFALALIPYLPSAFMPWLTFLLFSITMGAKYVVLGMSQYRIQNLLLEVLNG